MITSYAISRGRVKWLNRTTSSTRADIVFNGYAQYEKLKLGGMRLFPFESLSNVSLAAVFGLNTICGTTVGHTVNR